MSGKKYNVYIWKRLVDKWESIPSQQRSGWVNEQLEQADIKPKEVRVTDAEGNVFKARPSGEGLTITEYVGKDE